MNTKLVCYKCGADWAGSGSPCVCPVCKEMSCAIAKEDRK